MYVLRAENVSYDYKTPAGITHALKDVTADFEKGKIYSVTGRSGSGKTTLLSLLAAFDVPLSGKILYEGAEISEKELSKYRRENIGIVFQSYNLIPHLTALENVMLALDISKKNIGDKKKAAIDALESVGLDKSLYKKFPLTLSGGEQQRVAIARAVVAEPNVILADEPTGNLDNENSENIIFLLKKIAHEKNKCVIVVTHSREIADETDIEYVMSDGKIKNIRV